MNLKQTEQALISEVMQKHIYCVTEQQSVEELVSLFLDKGINAAPVIDDSGAPIGIVSKSDIIRDFKDSYGAKPSEIDDQVRPWWDTNRLSQLKVGEIMTPTLYTFSPATTVADAIATMAFEGIHHIPVVSDSGRLVGILSALDMLEWIARQAGYQPAEGQNGQIFKRPA